VLVIHSHSMLIPLSTSNVGEYESLNAISSIVTDLCPRALAHGPLAEGKYFLATEFLHIGGIGIGGESLAAKLGKLHSTPAPSQGRYGFPVTTYWYASQFSYSIHGLSVALMSQLS
jgi:hypothetical protein